MTSLKCHFQICIFIVLSIVLIGCSSTRQDATSDFANEQWRYESLNNPNLRNQKLEEIRQAEESNKEYADRALADAERRIETQGRKRSPKTSDQLISPPPDNASEDELDDYAERLRKLLDQ